MCYQEREQDNLLIVILERAQVGLDKVKSVICGCDRVSEVNKLWIFIHERTLVGLDKVKSKLLKTSGVLVFIWRSRV